MSQSRARAEKRSQTITPEESPGSPRLSTHDRAVGARSPERPIRYIYRWDLDKTYLDTDFRIHRIWRVAFESAAARRNIPGSATLLRELVRTADVPIPRSGVHPGARAQVIFISGSPRQMRAQIEEKFRLDGLTPDVLHLKPNLENFVSLRWRAIREQVGYKLPLLLEARGDAPVGVHETCFGDDSESDAFIYSMYADLLAGRIGDFTLRAMMEAAGAYPEAILRARTARLRLPRGAVVDRIYIHLAERTHPSRFAPYGPRVVPIHDYFQAALCLYEDGRLSAGGVVSVAYDLLARYGFTLRRIARSFRDILQRGFFAISSADALAKALEDMHFPSPLPPRVDAIAFLTRLVEEVPAGVQPPLEPTFIDYPALIETLRQKVARAEQEGSLPGPTRAGQLEASGVLAEEDILEAQVSIPFDPMHFRPEDDEDRLAQASDPLPGARAKSSLPFEP